MESHKGPLGIGIERDVHFQADKTLSEYATEARAQGCVQQWRIFRRVDRNNNKCLKLCKKIAVI